MRPEDTKIIRSTWQSVAQIADDAARLFYQRLFVTAPEIRSLFAHTDMPAQRARLVQAITLVVDSLDRLDALLPTLQALGQRHTAYGVVADHYQRVGEALLWTLAEGLGDAWTEDAERAWAAMFHIVADAMQKPPAFAAVQAS